MVSVHTVTVVISCICSSCICVHIMLMSYTVHGHMYPSSHCDPGHTMALLALWPCSHQTKLFPSLSWLSSKAKREKAFHGQPTNCWGSMSSPPMPPDTLDT